MCSDHSDVLSSDSPSPHSLGGTNRKGESWKLASSRVVLNHNMPYEMRLCVHITDKTYCRHVYVHFM